MFFFCCFVGVNSDYVFSVVHSCDGVDTMLVVVVILVVFGMCWVEPAVKEGSLKESENIVSINKNCLGVVETLFGAAVAGSELIVKSSNWLEFNWSWTSILLPLLCCTLVKGNIL